MSAVFEMRALRLCVNEPVKEASCGNVAVQGFAGQEFASKIVGSNGLVKEARAVWEL